MTTLADKAIERSLRQQEAVRIAYDPGIAEQLERLAMRHTVGRKECSFVGHQIGQGQWTVVLDLEAWK